MLPFLETKLSEDILIREFDQKDSEEFAWHQDREPREIELVSGTGWKIQLDNSIPVSLEIGMKITIPAKYWHRLIKGEGKCKIKIKKLYMY